MKKLLLLCLVVFLVVPAFADTQVYTTATSWGTAVGTFTTWSTSAGAWPAGLTVNSSYGAGTFQLGGGAFAGQTVFHDIVNPSTLPLGTTFTFANAITSFGAFWDLYYPGGPGTGIAVYIDGVFVGNIDNALAGGFWGFTSTTPFTSILLKVDGQSGSQETYEISQIMYGVPEPGSMLLLGTGLIGLARIVRRRV